MVEKKSSSQIEDIYNTVSSSDALLFHVAHARKENTDEEYDGEALLEIAKRRVSQDVEDLRTAAEYFRETSVPRS